jgi:hypothetical protein
MSDKKHIPNPVGAPRQMIGGKRRNIYIDEASWQRAKELGNGKPSEGIRIALRKCLTQ